MNKCKWTALMAVMLFVLSSCSAKQEDTIALADPVEVKYDSAVAMRGYIAQRKLYEAYVKPNVESVAFENRSGLFETFYVTLGDRVKKGDPVAKMNTSDLEESIAAARDNIAYKKKKLQYDLEQKQFDIDSAQIDLDALRSKNAKISDIELTQVTLDKLKSEAEYISKNAMVDITQAEQQLKDLEASAEGSVITAPCNGEVVFVDKLFSGDRVAAFKPIVYVADDTQLSVQYSGTDSISGSTRIAAQIGDKEYDLVKVEYDAAEYLSMVLEGKKPPNIYNFTESLKDVSAGDFAALIVYSDERQDVLYIPINALYYSSGINYVYKLIDGQKVYTEVTSGLKTNSYVEITGGLQEGDVVFVKQ